jgi:hypothetical protein
MGGPSKEPARSAPEALKLAAQFADQAKKPRDLLPRLDAIVLALLSGHLTAQASQVAVSVVKMQAMLLGVKGHPQDGMSDAQASQLAAALGASVEQVQAMTEAELHEAVRAMQERALEPPPGF